MKICIVTSCSALDEPRAPRHALSARRAFPDADITFVDHVAAGEPRCRMPPQLKGADVCRISVEYPTRTNDIARLAVRKAATAIARARFERTGKVTEQVFGNRYQGLTKRLKAVGADVYIAHNIETLLPAADAAGDRGTLVLDCMEYYSDMGDSQSATEAKAARVLEEIWLRRCALVLASSDSLADELALQYGIVRPFQSYNVPPREPELPARRGGGLNLYWRNAVVGFGQRGLDDAMVAVALLPSDVKLYLQGRAPADGGKTLRQRAGELGISGRVTLLPPYEPQNAVREAAPNSIGLCLERAGPRNHDLTVSNKMFDYHMAGLAVISSDLPGLRKVIEKSSGGLLYESGNPASLAGAISQLRNDPAGLARLQTNARTFAMEEANLEVELERLTKVFRQTLSASSQNLGRRT